MSEPMPARAHVVLTGESFALRPYRDDDAAAVLEASTDPALRLWSGLPADASELSEWLTKRQAWTDHQTWAMVDADSGDLLGGVSLFHIDEQHARGEIGYWTTPTARGRGLVPQAVNVVADHAFGTLGLERLELHHALENTSSCRAALKCGFIVEGTVRSAFRYGDGVLHDEHIHGRLRADHVP